MKVLIIIFLSFKIYSCSTSTIKTNEPSQNTTDSTSGVFHKVLRGETLKSIAGKYGVKIDDIREWNNISGNKIIAGTKLKYLLIAQVSIECFVEKH